MTDWQLIFNEYKKSEQLKGNSTENLTWYLDANDWEDFKKYCDYIFNISIEGVEIINLVGVQVRPFYMV